MAEERTLTVRVHAEPDGSLWAEVNELPGCFASGFSSGELQEALIEAIELYLSTPERPARVKLVNDGRELESVREERILVCN